MVFYAGKAPQPSWVQDFHEKTFGEAAFTVAGIPLTKLLDDPEFVINRVYDQVREGRRLARVDFTNASPPNQEIKISGWFLLDPANSWVVREYEFKFDPIKNPQVRSVKRGTIQYDESSPGKGRRRSWSHTRSRTLLMPMRRAIDFNPSESSSSRSRPRNLRSQHSGWVMRCQLRVQACP